MDTDRKDRDMTYNLDISSRLSELALDGILPFMAIVQRREDGRWVSQASGSSVAWLLGEAYSEADFGPVRIVPIWDASN